MGKKFVWFDGEIGGCDFFVGNFFFMVDIVVIMVCDFVKMVKIDIFEEFENVYVWMGWVMLWLSYLV